MTIQEAIDNMDEMKPNAMSPRLKMKNLTTIEQLIHSEVVMRHVHTPEQEALLDGYVLEETRGFVLFAVCDEPEAVRSAFKDHL